MLYIDIVQSHVGGNWIKTVAVCSEPGSWFVYTSQLSQAWHDLGPSFSLRGFPLNILSSTRVKNPKWFQKYKFTSPQQDIIAEITPHVFCPEVEYKTDQKKSF